jgi:hypothetical protein
MIEHKIRNKGYTTHRKRIEGKGFVDTLLSSAKSVGSYIAQNKDLIAKPLLGAVGNLAATGLTEGGIALLNHIKRNQLDPRNKANQLDAKSKEILQSLIEGSNPVTNIIGSGIKKF